MKYLEIITFYYNDEMFLREINCLFFFSHQIKSVYQQQMFSFTKNNGLCFILKWHIYLNISLNDLNDLSVTEKCSYTSRWQRRSGHW